MRAGANIFLFLFAGEKIMCAGAFPAFFIFISEVHDYQHERDANQ